MAEGWARALLGHVVEAHSAGVDPGEVDASAVEAMAEAGVDISTNRPKRIDAERLEDFDCVVTLSERARAAIAASGYSGNIQHANVPSSPKSGGTGQDGYYRRLRDEIRVLVLSLRWSVGRRLAESIIPRR